MLKKKIDRPKIKRNQRKAFEEILVMNGIKPKKLEVEVKADPTATLKSVNKVEEKKEEVVKSEDNNSEEKIA